MLAEAKGRLIHSAAKNFIERVIKGVPLDSVEGATLESARHLDQQRGNFQESAQHYFTVLVYSPFNVEKSEALIGLSQQLINLGSFRQVRAWLNNPYALVGSLYTLERIRFESQLKSKEGWINDYELGFLQSRRCFDQSRELLNEIPRSQWNGGDRELYSTALHFLGRSAYGLASFGIHKEGNIEEAVEDFEEAISLDREFPDSADLKTGFGHGWLARCHLLLGDITQADEELILMERDFMRQLRLTPGRIDLMAHYHVLRCIYNLKRGFVQGAREHASDAIRIRTINNYPKGLADAYLGMAATYWADKNPVKAFSYTAKAVKSHPYSALRGIIGA